MEAAKAHVEATSGGDPATRFVEVLRSLFAAGKAHVRDRETGKHPPGWEDLWWEDETDDKAPDMYHPKHGTEFVGWADADHLYLGRPPTPPLPGSQLVGGYRSGSSRGLSGGH